MGLMAEMLDDLAAGRWMASKPGFVSPSTRLASFFPDVWISNVDHPWGPAGCPIGFACLDVRFPGLNLKDAQPAARASALRPGHPPRLAVGWDAVCCYFDLDEPTAQWLFGPCGNPGSFAQVASWVKMTIEHATRTSIQDASLNTSRLIRAAS